MSKWFPDTSDYAGAKAALKGGVWSSFAFAAMNALGVVLLIATNKTPSLGQQVESPVSAALGILLEMAFVLVAAWRFGAGKGLIIGALAFALFLVEVVAKVIGGTTNGGWMIAYVAVAAGFINGLRGAWAMRQFDRRDASVESEVFE